MNSGTLEQTRNAARLNEASRIAWHSRPENRPPISDQWLSDPRNLGFLSPTGGFLCTWLEAGVYELGPFAIEDLSAENLRAVLDRLFRETDCVSVAIQVPIGVLGLCDGLAELGFRTIASREIEPAMGDAFAVGLLTLNAAQWLTTVATQSRH